MQPRDNDTLRIHAGKFAALQYQGTDNNPYFSLKQLRDDLRLKVAGLPEMADLEGNTLKQKTRSLIDSYFQRGYPFSKLFQQFAEDYPVQIAQSSDLLVESFNFASDLLGEGGEESAREANAILAILDDHPNSWDSVCQAIDRKLGDFLNNKKWEDQAKQVGRIRRIPRATEKRQCLPHVVLPGELYEQGCAAEESGYWDEAESKYEELGHAYPTYKSDAPQRLDELRQYRQGWDLVVGDSPDYESAVAILQPLKHSSTQVLQRRLLDDLKRRVGDLQKEGDWDRSHALLQGMRQAMPAPDVLDGLAEKARRPGEYYAQAQKLIVDRRWDEAGAKFSEIDAQYPAYRDTRHWLENLQRWETWYTDGKEAWEAENWDESLRVLGELAKQEPAYRDAPERLHKLQKCQEALRTASSFLDDKLLLVNTNGWREAEALLELCQQLIPRFGDAAVALQYLQSLRAIHERRWKDANSLLTEIEGAQGGYRDVRDLRTGLQLRETLATLTSQGHLEPSLDWPGGYPYEVLRSAGLAIAPKASLAEVRDAAWSLQQAGMTPVQRQAWDDLRNLDRRLFVDAFLLPLEKTIEMRVFVEEQLVDRLSGLGVDVLANRFPEQSVYLKAMLKDFAGAVGQNLKAQRQNPASTELAGRAALLGLSWAEGLDRDRQFQEADIAWQQVIGEWAIWLTDERYWKTWAAEKARHYGQAVLATQSDDLLARLEEELARRLGEADLRRRPKQGAGPVAASTLQWEWRAELAAVRWLRQFDGAPTQAHGRVACGPRLLEVLNLTQALGEYAARLSEQHSSIADQLAGAPSEDDVRHLRQCYSALAPAAVLLETTQPLPAQALQLLTHADCGHCPPCYDPFCPLHAAVDSNIRVCCGKCPNFRRRNPAYNYLSSDQSGWLYEDAQRLALQAHMSLAQEIMVRDQEWDLTAIRRSWAEALRLAEELGDHDLVAEQVRTTAVGRASVLGRDPSLHTDSTRLDRAAALLDTAISLVRGTPQMQLRLGDVLTDRASYYLKRDEHERAVEDFERAYTIVGLLEQMGMQPPYRHRTQDLYATALSWRALDMAKQDREQAMTLLEQAQDLAKQGLAKKPDYDEYRKTLDLIDNVRAIVEDRLPTWLADDAATMLDRVLESAQPGVGNREAVARLLTESSEQRRQGNLAAGLDSLSHAWALAPDDQGIQEELIEATIQRAGQLLASGSASEARLLVDEWAVRLLGSPWVADRLDYLRWAPTIQHLLKQTDLKWRDTGRAMQFPFDSAAVGTVILRLFIQGDAGLIAAPLPPMSETDESVIYGNVLQNTGDLTLVRLSHLEAVGPSLASHVPIRLLNSVWLEFLLRGLARYVDMQPSFLRSPAQLRVHLRSQRDLLRLIQPDRGRAQRTLLNLPQMCQTQLGWSCQEVESGRWRLETQVGTIIAVGGDDGIRLAQELGAVSYNATPRAIAIRNSHLGLGKLSLDDGGRVWLACEVPYLDVEGFQSMAGFFVEHSPVIRQEFCVR